MLRHYLRRRRGTVALLGVLLLASTGAQALTPLIVRHVIDAATAGAALADLVWWGAAYGGAATLAYVVTVVATLLSVRIGWQSTNALRTDLLRHTVRLDLRFHHDHTPGEMIERVDGDITLMSNYFAEFAVQIVGNALVIIGVMAVVFSQDWRVGAVMAGYVTVSWSLLLALRSIGVEQWQRTRQASGELFGFLEETLTGMEDIHTSAGQPFVIRQFYRLTRRFLRHQIKAAMRTTFMVNSWLMVDTLGFAVGLGLGAFLYLHGGATLGVAYLVFHYAGMMSRPLRVVTWQMEDLQRAAAAARRAVRLFRARSALPAPPVRFDAGARRPSLAPGPLAIDFDAVTFGYDPANPVLEEVSLHVPPGEVLGLIGRTGSGKTTLSRLLFRFYDVDRGSVRLGGHDVRSLDLADLRARLAMVNQRVDLVHGSVHDNLTLFDTAVPDERVREVLDDLGLGRWWRELPHGIHTELAGQNAELSAGQAQLLAFGRAFLLSEPGVVVLDEASSRLDPGTERSIERAVDRLVAGRTAIIIAHRLATVMRADRIALLDGGRLAEFGRRGDLLADPASRLSQLLRSARGSREPRAHGSHESEEVLQ